MKVTAYTILAPKFSLDIFLGHVELAVLRGCCAPCPNLIDYVNDVIAQAVEDRRNCHVSVLCLCMEYSDLYIT